MGMHAVTSKPGAVSALRDHLAAPENRAPSLQTLAKQCVSYKNVLAGA